MKPGRNMRLAGMMRKECLQVIRDPSSIAIAFFLPMVLLLIFGYGVSLALFVLGLRHLGTARTGAYFSLAPFVGALLAVAFLDDPLSLRLLLAGALVALGLWLHLTERHEHEHLHEAMDHEHRHVHDAHHRHHHEPGEAVTEPHTHRHRHEPLRHKHPHHFGPRQVQLQRTRPAASVAALDSPAIQAQIMMALIAFQLGKLRPA